MAKTRCRPKPIKASTSVLDKIAKRVRAILADPLVIDSILLRQTKPFCE